MTSSTNPKGPDLTQGIFVSALRDGEPFLGHVDGEPVIVVKRGEEIFAVGATCPHYGGPLERGLVRGETIKCPLHHATFSLREGNRARYRRSSPSLVMTSMRDPTA